MPPTRRVVVDVLKPHSPPLLEFTERLAAVESVAAVRASLVEIDREVENLRLIVEGEELAYDAVADAVESLGGTVHSVDEVACGEYVVADSSPPRDGRP